MIKETFNMKCAGVCHVKYGEEFTMFIFKTPLGAIEVYRSNSDMWENDFEELYQGLKAEVIEELKKLVSKL